jgi:hypothetical protein
MPAGYAGLAGNGTSTVPVMDERGFLNSDPDAAFWRYLQNAGYAAPGVASTNFGKYAQAQQDRVYKGYKSVAAADPNQGFYDYLEQNHPDLQGEFMSQSPEQRGDFSSRLMTPRARWASG